MPAQGDFSWVRPGLAINDWTNDDTVVDGGFKGAMDNRTMKYFIDFCHDYGLDYIITGFTNRNRNNYQIVWDKFQTLGTRCNQLAQLIVFESGFQVLADYPDNYRNAMGSELLRYIPGCWDEIRVLNASVGNYVTIARRKNADWYVGSMTSWKARDLIYPLTFLNDGIYSLEMYRDGKDAEKNAEDTELINMKVTKRDTLTIHLASGGGNVPRIYKN